MRRIGGLVVLVIVALRSSALAFTCDAEFVRQSLEWCSRDHGFNEGAVCGANALSGAGVGGLPAMAGAAVLGNTWDRTNMMGAAKAACPGNPDAAANAAVCCQIHNGPVHDCLASRIPDVKNWLCQR